MKEKKIGNERERGVKWRVRMKKKDSMRIIIKIIKKKKKAKELVKYKHKKTFINEISISPSHTCNVR